MKAIAYSGNILLKLAAILTLNVLLFMVIPLSQNFLKLFEDKKSTFDTQKRIIAEYVKPDQKEEKPKPKSRIREVSNTSTQPLQNPGKFKFSPDLSVGSGGDGVAIQGQQLEAEVFEEGDVDVIAAPRFQPQPPYPDKARELAIEGMVKVVFVVDVSGNVSSIRSIEAPHQSFDKVVREVVSTWKFSPAVKRGVPVKSVMSIVIEYGLN